MSTHFGIPSIPYKEAKSIPCVGTDKLQPATCVPWELTDDKKHDLIHDEKRNRWTRIPEK